MPLCIICTINMVFFLLTALKIRRVQQDLKKVTSQEESSRHQSKFNHDKDKWVYNMNPTKTSFWLLHDNNMRFSSSLCHSFILFLRLFIVMGVTWSMEAISFLISRTSNVFLLTDTCNTIQGVLIFVLFVLKRRVLRLIKKRFVYISSSCS